MARGLLLTNKNNPSVKPGSLFLTLLIFLMGCRSEQPPVFQSQWSKISVRTWTGPDYWANRLQDWRISQGRAECVSLYPLRTLHLLTAAVTEATGTLQSSVTLGWEAMQTDTVPAAAGFLLGAGQGLDYRAAALIHHSTGRLAGLFAGIDSHGRLFVNDLENDSLLLSTNAGIRSDSLRLQLIINAKNQLSLTAVNPETGAVHQQLELPGLASSRFSGRLGLVAHGQSPAPEGRIWFRDWQVGGSRLARFPERHCGPVITAQHTLSGKVLKITAQLMPVGQGDATLVSLELQREGRWQQVAQSEIISPGYTAPFRLSGWEESEPVPYRLSYQVQEHERPFYFSGIIRPDPIGQDTLVVAAFTGNHAVVRPDRANWGGVDVGHFPWDWGLWFPNEELVARIRSQDPDLLFFSGDQVYEGASPTWADFSEPELDYLYKWYLWCWEFAPLTADIPTVTIPDDHDVYHGNIWGAGGKATPPGLSGQQAQDAGGYKLPATFVNMVHRTQTSHLPAPYDPDPAGIGIINYYTSMTYGGVSFAVLEDRKFKSAPAPLMPAGQIVNGWIQNPGFDARTQGDPPSAQLLGARQLEFLEDWAADWSQGAWMKVALSQTIFANLATLPAGSQSDAVVPTLAIPQAGEYPPDDQPVADMDSNGWPRSGRDRAVRTLRKGFACHIAGDQHLGSTIQYGVDDWGDASFALCVPSIANFWARRWFPAREGQDRDPAAPPYTGRFEDGFGNKMTVYAVANPYQSGHEPTERHDKAAGYGIARLIRSERSVQFENWPLWSDPDSGGEPYPGWPVKFAQLENYGREAKGWLPPLLITGISDPVVQIFSERTGRLLYALRIQGNRFQPWVFAPGTYTIRIGEPDRDQWQELKGITANARQDIGQRKITF